MARLEIGFRSWVVHSVSSSDFGSVCRIFMRALVVSVHDVSPLTQASCDQILQTLRSLGVSEGSLLIIPNHHRQAPVRENAAFKDWVLDLVRQRYQPGPHAYFHPRPP